MEKQQDGMVYAIKVSAELDELVIDDNAVLIKAEQKIKSDIILNTGITSSLNGEEFVKNAIAKLGDSVKKYELGDIIYALKNENSPKYLIIDDENYYLTDVYNVALAVRKK